MNAHQLKEDIFDYNHPEKQVKAAYQMRYIQGDPEIIHILFRACYEAKNPKLQQEAAKTLEVLKPGLPLDTFKKSLHSKIVDKRMRAYYHIGTLGDRNGISAILPGLKDPDARVRRAAAVSLGRLGYNNSHLVALNGLLYPYEPDPVRSAAKVSMDMIRKRMNGVRRDRSEDRSFNAAGHSKKYTRNPFDKPRDFVKTYTPKGF